MIQVAESALQTSIDSLLTKDQDPCTYLAVNEQRQQAISPHWLPSAAISYAPAQNYQDQMVDIHNIPFQKFKVSAYADLQNPLWKLNKVLYHNAHILDMCATLKDLLQAGHPYIVFSQQLSFYKLLTHIFHARLW